VLELANCNVPIFRQMSSAGYQGSSRGSPVVEQSSETPTSEVRLQNLRARIGPVVVLFLKD